MTVLVGIINIAFDMCGHEPYSRKNGHDVISFSYLVTQFS